MAKPNASENGARAAPKPKKDKPAKSSPAGASAKPVKPAKTAASSKADPEQTGAKPKPAKDKAAKPKTAAADHAAAQASTSAQATESAKTDSKAKAEDGKTVVKPAKKPKAVYDMPGQTRPKPDEEDSLTIFYTSLLEQRPDSELANKWCASPIAARF